MVSNLFCVILFGSNSVWFCAELTVGMNKSIKLVQPSTGRFSLVLLSTIRVNVYFIVVARHRSPSSYHIHFFSLFLQKIIVGLFFRSRFTVCLLCVHKLSRQLFLFVILIFRPFLLHHFPFCHILFACTECLFYSHYPTSIITVYNFLLHNQIKAMRAYRHRHPNVFLEVNLQNGFSV